MLINVEQKDRRFGKRLEHPSWKSMSVFTTRKSRRIRSNEPTRVARKHRKSCMVLKLDKYLLTYQSELSSLISKVGGLELYESHIELKDRSKLTKDLERDLKMVEEHLKKEEAINSRLENQVSTFLEKRKHEENIIWLKRKSLALYAHFL